MKAMKLSFKAQHHHNNRYQNTDKTSHLQHMLLHITYKNMLCKYLLDNYDQSLV